MLFDDYDFNVVADGVTFDEASPMLLRRAIAIAQSSSTPKELIDVLNILQKQGYVDKERDRRYDIRKIMSIMTEEQLRMLE